jgi:hypothetical protein
MELPPHELPKRSLVKIKIILIQDSVYAHQYQSELDPL